MVNGEKARPPHSLPKPGEGRVGLIRKKQEGKAPKTRMSSSNYILVLEW
jgi:hypothetical protein